MRLRTSLDDNLKPAISLIAAMHGISTSDAKMKVKELQRKSLIYECGPTLRVHDLYIEFAWSVISMEGSKEREWWVGRRDANGYNLGLKRLLLFEDKSKICHPPQQLLQCPNLECLVMWNCGVTLPPKLDLECFPNLRVLMIWLSPPSKMEISCTIGDALNCDLSLCGRKADSKGCLPELRTVVLHGLDLRRTPFLRQCGDLTFLGIIWCDFDISDFTQDGASFFENLMALETFFFSFPLFWKFRSSEVDGILQSASKLKNLKLLEIDFVWVLGYKDYYYELDLSPLGSSTSLETLSLPNLPSCVKELSGLDQLSHLVELNLEGSWGLEKLPNLDLLPNLQRICVEGCKSLVVEDIVFTQGTMNVSNKGSGILRDFLLSF